MDFGKLVLTLTDEQEQEFKLAKASLTLGRSNASDITLMDARVSRSHARIDCGPHGCRVTDLGSSNGTRLNGVFVTQAELNPGDTLTLGSSRLRYERSPLSETSLMTVIDSESDLQTMLASMVLPVALNDTHSPRLAISGSERTWEISLEDKDRIAIGRSTASDLVLQSPTVSRNHAEIVRRGTAFVLRDLDSANGVWSGERKISELELEDSAHFRIGVYQLVFKQGFAEEALTLIAPQRPQAAVRRPVVFVPGFMGSELWLGSQRLWPGVRILFKQPELFAYTPGSRVEAPSLLGEVVLVPNLVKLEQYNRLGDYLVEELGYERGCDFFEFPYDWRQDVRLSARQLAQAVEAWPIQPPFILMAHSLGTLVSRYYVEKLGGKEKVQRLLLMGGPHLGTPTAATNLAIGPNLLPFGMLGEQLRQVLGTFPSVYQILPTYTCAVDQASRSIPMLEDESWLPEERRPLLRMARQFRKELGVKFSVPTVSIFGYGKNTAAGLKILRDAAGQWLQVNPENKPSGDDTIPERSAVLPQTEIHPVSQHHGSLYIDNDVKMRLKLELTRSV